jgi:hypothetical protein
MMRLGRRVIGPAMALLIIACVDSSSPAPTHAAPCASIERAVLQVRNLGGAAGDEQLSVGGELADGADFSAAFGAGRGVTLRLQDLGAGVADIVFDLSASGMPGPRRQRAQCEPGMDARTSRRGRTVRVYRRHDTAPGEDCSTDPRDGSALLRVAEGTDGVGIRFRLHTASTELARPTGPLRASIAIGTDSDERACATYTFGADECALNDSGTTLTCRANQDGPPPSAECRPTGCSSQVCAERDIVTSCEFLPHYACYRGATCERQSDGSCGWTATEDLQRCVAEASHTGPTPTPRPEPDAAWFACERDSDCAVYPGLDCCGCDLGGGPEVAINKSYRDAVDTYRQCGDILCPGEYLCRDGLEAVCDHGVCAVR